MPAHFGSQLTQAAITVFIGVVVYVVGRFIEGAVLEPLAEQRHIIAQVASVLTMYANLYTNPKVVREKPAAVDQAAWDREDELHREAAREIRGLSAALQGHNLSIPYYGLWTFLRLGPSRSQVLLAGANLIGISNATPPRDHNAMFQNMEWRKEILRDLGIAKIREKPLVSPSTTQQHEAQEQSGLM